MLTDETTLLDVLTTFSREDRANLLSIIERKKIGIPPTAEDLHDKFKSLYISKARKKGATVVGGLIDAGTEKVFDRKFVNAVSYEDSELPPYRFLVREAAKELKVYEPDEPTFTNMINIGQELIITTLRKQKPAARRKIFESLSSELDTASQSKLRDKRFDGPATAFGVFGAANATGFGVYVVSSAAVGLITNAIGITLPFAFYTTMSSVIAAALGPPGFIIGTAYVAMKVTGKQWDVMLPAICYINAVITRDE